MSLTEQREGIDAGRLDMFVDGAFAFTLTLLVIGGDVVPDSAEALLLSAPAPSPLWALPGFLYALMFLIGPLVARFRRRHGMG